MEDIDRADFKREMRRKELARRVSPGGAMGGGAVKCLACGLEMDEAESFASVVPGSDIVEYWRCRPCGVDVAPKVSMWREEGFGPGRWKKVPEGCLLVMGREKG